jgi:hypothetical protein
VSHGRRDSGVVGWKQEEAEEKEQRVADQSIRQEEKAAMKAEWVEIKRVHELDIQDREAWCRQLELEGVWKKDWPKKLGHCRKPRHLEQSLGNAREGAGSAEGATTQVA